MCVIVHLLSFKCFYITGNHRQKARVKVPVDVKPFKKYTQLYHTQCIQVTMNKLVGMSDLGLELESCCFGSCYPISYLRNRFYVNAVANTAQVSPSFWVVSQAANKLIYPCQGQIVGWRSSSYLRHTPDTDLWFQGIVLSRIQNRLC